MKHHLRLDYGRLAEVLHEQGKGNVDTIRELLQHSKDGGMAFCEALVTTNLVEDWELSRIVCETFHLPFLPIDLVEPNPKAIEAIDAALFKKHQLVPIDCFGQLLTVAMPALVQADVLAMVSAASDFVILPVVGTVETNRRWITEHFSDVESTEINGGWGNLFDQADADVQASLDDEDGDEFGMGDLGSPDNLDALDRSSATAVNDEETLDLAALGDSLGDLDNLEIEAIDAEDFEIDTIDEADAAAAESQAADDQGTGGAALPPMPEFGGDRQAG